MKTLAGMLQNSLHCLVLIFSLKSLVKSSKLIINQKCKNTERFEDTVHEIGSDIGSSVTDALFVPVPNTHHLLTWPHRRIFRIQKYRLIVIQATLSSQHRTVQWEGPSRALIFWNLGLDCFFYIKYVLCGTTLENISTNTLSWKEVFLLKFLCDITS